MLDPSYISRKPLEQTIATKDNKTEKNFKETDNFGGELKYFSDLILNDKDPEHDGKVKDGSLLKVPLLKVPLLKVPLFGSRGIL